MNKYLKGFLIAGWMAFIAFVALVVIAVILAGLVALFFYFTGSNNERRKAEAHAMYDHVCDTAQYVDAQPRIQLEDFAVSEVSDIHFYLIRGDRVLRDTIIATTDNDWDPARDLKLDIPYDHFKKTDTIVVSTRDSIAFKLSGFRYYAGLHMTQMGYAGSYECEFDTEHYTVNGKENDSYLYKSAGLRRYVPPKRKGY